MKDLNTSLNLNQLYLNRGFFQIQKYVWLIYLKKYNKTKNADIIKLIAFSNQKYDWNPELMEKDAFQCIQNIGKELNN